MLNKIWIIYLQDGLAGMFRRIWAKVLSVLKARVEEALSRRKSSYSLDSSIYSTQLTPRINEKAFVGLSLKECIPQTVSKHYINHRFDLLGSGWTQVRYGMRCRGMEEYRYNKTNDVLPDSSGDWLKNRLNRANLPTAQKIWQRVNENYIAIDWQLDFKSGYRWSEKIWSPRLLYGQPPGADIKVPWELSRMQHLPQLALRASALGKNDKEALLLVREIKNQWLDFIATNPPGFGVNWACPMDVAIRVSNWCMAWDILQASGFLVETEDKVILAHSLHDHGCYIVKHLEWSSDRANHYLANITGLAFIASYLQSSEETDSWLAFSIQELVVEVGRQFYEDGTNFEGSTAYHRLSAEMVFFSTALILGLPLSIQDKLKKNKYKEVKIEKNGFPTQERHLQFYSLPNNFSLTQQESPFPKWYFERMERMAEFIMDITKPNGNIPQIGDNDNGRFLKLYPNYHRMSVIQAKQKYVNLRGYDSLSDDMDYHVENHLDCRHLVSAAYALFARSDFKVWFKKRSTRKINNQDYFVIKSLSNNISIHAQHSISTNKSKSLYSIIGAEKEFNKAILSIEKKNNNCVLLFKSSIKSNKPNDKISLYSYPDFGLYLFVSKSIYLAVRCWPGKKPYVKSHMHLDQFSVELVIDGKEIISDPGSYIYTPAPLERWKYRSNEAHFSSMVDVDIENWKKLDPFGAVTLKPAYPSYFGLRGFFSSVGGDLEYGRYCLISIRDNEIKLYGFAQDHNHPDKRFIGNKISDGYGSISNNLSFATVDED